MWRYPHQKSGLNELRFELYKFSMFVDKLVLSSIFGCNGLFLKAHYLKDASQSSPLYLLYTCTCCPYEWNGVWRNISCASSLSFYLSCSRRSVQWKVILRVNIKKLVSLDLHLKSHALFISQWHACSSSLACCVTTGKPSRHSHSWCLVISGSWTNDKIPYWVIRQAHRWPLYFHHR